MENPALREGRGAAAPPGSVAELRAAIKRRDSWWPTLFSGPVANRLVGLLRRYPRIHPNHVTLVGMGIALVAASCLARGTHGALVAGGLLVQLAFIFDCVDGQLARYRGQTSEFGAILDRIFDRVKPFLYFGALAWGAQARSPDDSLWLAALAACLGFSLVDVYREQYARLAGGSAPSGGEQGSFPPALRALDLPFIRLNGGDHYFLITLFCFADAVRPLLYLVASVAMLQVVFRPMYYLAAFRRSHGVWPWQTG